MALNDRLVLNTEFVLELEQVVLQPEQESTTDDEAIENLFRQILSRLHSGELQSPYLGPLTVILELAREVGLAQQEDDLFVKERGKALFQQEFGNNSKCSTLAHLSTLSWEVLEWASGESLFAPVLRLPTIRDIGDQNVLDCIKGYQRIVGWPIYVLIGQQGELVQPDDSQEKIRELFI